MDATELTSGFDPAQLAPGRYFATAPSTAYRDLWAMALAGRGRIVGEHYTTAGEKVVTVDYQLAKRNDPEEVRHIGIGREYFITALRDYANWPEKWWREAIQNAVDAGATRIDCSVEKGDNGDYWKVECHDNGSGMDEDTLLSRFLMLGGSTKKTGATTGGFGKAKELLLLPWITWSIQSRDIIAAGAGTDYKVQRGQPFHKGTVIRVAMPDGQSTAAHHALAFINKCTLPNVRFTVNGTPVRANAKTGKALETLPSGAAELFYNAKLTDAGGILVRINGLFMFNMWLDSSIKGTVFVELLKPSVELLTANRDGFRDYLLRREVESFKTRLAKDVMTTLSGSKNLIRNRYRGSGLLDVETSRLISADLFSTLTTKPKTRSKNAVVQTQIEVTEASAEKATQILTRILGEVGTTSDATIEGDHVSLGVAPPSLITPLLAFVSTETQLEHAVQQLAWQPDFLVVNEEDDFRVPRALLPRNMTAGHLKLAKLWAELCRFVLIQLGSQRRYGVGWIFSKTKGAAYYEYEDEPWLLLNPARSPRNLTRFGGTSDFYRATNEDDLRWLYAAAVHEATHMADNIAYHDEAFAAALTNNIAKTVPGWKIVKKISSAVRART